MKIKKSCNKLSERLSLLTGTRTLESLNSFAFRSFAHNLSKLGYIEITEDLVEIKDLILELSTSSAQILSPDIRASVERVRVLKS